MPATKQPCATEYIECLNWRALKLHLNQAAEKRLRSMMGITLNYLDAEAEEKARCHANPLIRKAFQEWQDTERELDKAMELLQAAVDIQQRRKLDDIFKGLDC